MKTALAILDDTNYYVVEAEVVTEPERLWQLIGATRKGLISLDPCGIAASDLIDRISLLTDQAWFIVGKKGTVKLVSYKPDWLTRQDLSDTRFVRENVCDGLTAYRVELFRRRYSSLHKGVNSAEGYDEYVALLLNLVAELYDDNLLSSTYRLLQLKIYGGWCTSGFDLALKKLKVYSLDSITFQDILSGFMLLNQHIISMKLPTESDRPDMHLLLRSLYSDKIKFYNFLQSTVGFRSAELVLLGVVLNQHDLDEVILLCDKMLRNRKSTFPVFGKKEPLRLSQKALDMVTIVLRQDLSPVFANID